MNYSKQGKCIMAACLIIIMYCIVVNIALGTMCYAIDADPVDIQPMEVLETDEPMETLATVEEPIPEVRYISLGEFMLTAYCSCEKCCGYWATVRPLDEAGNPIVYTADGNIATQGVTIAADANLFPFGTSLFVEGHEYIVQDRGGAIIGNHIDIYFESHEEALQFGIQYKEVFVKEGDA